MNFCTLCGNPTESRIPDDDNRERDICTVCGEVHYVNPKNVCGCILEWQDKILLCKRAIEPRYGFWTLPAGFMENGETLVEGAAREAIEEANAHSDDLQLFALYSLPRISQVYVMYRGTLRDGQASAGAESLEVALYDEANIPWGDMAFPVAVETLWCYLEDRRQGRFGIHQATIFSRPGQPLVIERG